MEASISEVRRILAQHGVVSKTFPEDPGILHPAFSIEVPVSIGKEVYWQAAGSIGAYSMLHGPGRVVYAQVGRYCSFAPGSTIGSNEHALTWLTTSSLAENPHLYSWSSLRGRPEDEAAPACAFADAVAFTRIGNDVLIGAGAFVRSGVTIGDGAVIGAMANVIEDVPPYAVVVGNPARVVRKRFDDGLIADLLDLQWWRYSIYDLMRFDLTDPATAVNEIRKAETSGALTPYAPMRITRDSFAHIAGIQVASPNDY